MVKRQSSLAMTAVALHAESRLTQARLRIRGGRQLAGEVSVNGAKNSALVLMATSLLTAEPLRLRNVPDLTDIGTMACILSNLGVSCKLGGGQLRLDGSGLNHWAPAYELTNALRASFFIIGPLLARKGIARIPLPGGCKIGSRPVVEHVKGLRALGAHVTIRHGIVSAAIPDTARRLRGTHIHLDWPSVGATETLMMAAVLARGETCIDNAAQEPEVVDLAGLLIAMGACIRGAGSPSITVIGVERLKGADYTVIPDRIEAGTLLLAAAITRSSLRVGPVVPAHLGAVIAKLEEVGCRIERNGIGLVIDARGPLTACDIRTQPFPGFPTDLQAPFMALLSTVEGNAMVMETVFENRMQHVAELQRMGANIRLQGSCAHILGVPTLSGAPVSGSDLRAAAAMVLAGLAADGITTVTGLHHLDRGYHQLEKRLGSVGASIERLPQEACRS